MDNYKYKWRYTKEEVLNNNFPKRSCCYDCGIKYVDFQELLVSNELWEKIRPSPYEHGGLLCPRCIADRAAYLGLWLKENVYMSKKYYDEVIEQYANQISKLHEYCDNTIEVYQKQIEKLNNYIESLKTIIKAKNNLNNM
ncbi:MAG: hypothetical protein ACM3O3_12495 [Syntrophothermus sp.]